MHLVNARLTGARLMHVKDLVQGKYLIPALWCFHKIEKMVLLWASLSVQCWSPWRATKGAGGEGGIL